MENEIFPLFLLKFSLHLAFSGSLQREIAGINWMFPSINELPEPVLFIWSLRSNEVLSSVFPFMGPCQGQTEEIRQRRERY